MAPMAATNDPNRLIDPTRIINFCDYAVCFLDLLNQRHQLEGLRHIASNPEEQAVFQQAARNTVATICHIRAGIEDFVRQFTEAATLPEGLTEAQTVFAEQHMTVRVSTQHFSDTSLLFLPVSPTVSHCLKSLHGMMMGIGMLHTAALASKVAIRGSVEVAMGTDGLPGEVYGPVLADAYALEQKVAQYPRVVVGDGFGAFVDALAAEDGDSPGTVYSRGIAASLRRMVHVDLDGSRMLHTLGPEFHRAARGAGMSFGPTVDRAQAFVRTCLSHFTDVGNSVLAERYGRLSRYFDQNAWRWAEP
jgi:hypothetical protein